MTCQGIPLATRGMIFIPKVTVTDGVGRYVLPFNLQLTSDVIKLNLKYLETIKLNTFIDQKKLSLLKLENLKLNQKITTDLKLNLKKCEE